MIRRTFFRFATGGAIGTAAAGVSLRALSRFNAALEAEQLRVPGGPEAWASSVCTLCPAGCGLRVRTIGGRAVKIQGNPLNPVNHGGLCPKGLAGLQELYHPDRLRKPAKNIGSRAKPRWREISWDEALAAMAGQLEKLRANPQGAVFIDRHGRDLTSRLFRRFLAAYGSPNYFTMPSGLDAVEAALYLQQGVAAPVAYDLENTRYLLSFGVNFLEGWGSPTAVMRAFGRWRDSASGRRTKFVQVEPRLSLTAARADEWVALRPGADATLALGIAYALITEELYDAAFVRDHTFGFDDFKDAAGKTHMGFRSLVLSEYRLNDVAEFTGVSAENILRLAREFAANRPAVAIGDRQTSTLAGDPYAAMAVHSLNALVGSLDVPGGVLVQPELPVSGEEDTRPGAARTCVTDAHAHPFPGRRLAHLPEAILSGKPYPVQAVFLHQADPVFAMPNGEAFRRALEKVPFVASFTTVPGEASNLADLALPAMSPLESWSEAGPPPAFPFALFSIAPPAVACRNQSRHPGDVVLELARRLGGPVAAALPFTGVEAWLKQKVGELFESHSGSVYSTSLEESWNRLLERSGWWAPTYSTAGELWDQMKQNGGWWEPAYPHGAWERVLKTPSGRFEFSSQRLAQWAAQRPEFARAAGCQPGDDRLSLPHQPPLKSAPAGYPLTLMPVEVLPLAGAHGAHLPYLQQIAGPHLFASWEGWLEIHPQTAAKLGITDGGWVWVESPRGRTRVRARLYAGARPEVVHLPLGYPQALAVVEGSYEPVAGLPRWAGTPVKVYRG